MRAVRQITCEGLHPIPLGRGYHPTFVAGFGARNNRQVDFRPVSRNVKGLWNGADSASRHREWPWVQSGFLTLHCLVLRMHAARPVTGILIGRSR